MTTFYICRHGQTENNQKKRLSGWIDTPLTEEGIKNAASAAVKLEGVTFDVIVSSDLGRAFLTAYIIARHLGYTAEIERLSGFREVNYGDLANLPYTGPNVAYPVLTPEANTNYVPPNGESLAHMQQRVLTCVERLSQEHAGQTVLIVAHDGTINALSASYTHQDIGVVDAKSSNQHDFVARFTWDNGMVTSFEEVA